MADMHGHMEPDAAVPIAAAFYLSCTRGSAGHLDLLYPRLHSGRGSL